MLLALLTLFACDLDPGEPPPRGYGVQGIDVSHHQGWVDWEGVARDDVDFVYLKATEGSTHTDRRFARNWREARAQGLRVGAYHYLSLCRSGTDQAEHFISRVPRAEDALPPVVDIEPDGRCNRGERLRGAQTVVDAWIAAVQSHYGVEPLVYSSAGFHRHHLASSSSPRWVAAYSRVPRGTWTFWQYTDRGRVRGIRGPVDRNVYVGTRDGLAALGRTIR